MFTLFSYQDSANSPASAFDLVHQGDADLTGWPYRRRRTALEKLFTDHGLAAPLTLCPSTTDPAITAQWLAWTAAGLEGLCPARKRRTRRHTPPGTATGPSPAAPAGRLRPR
ncbi:hypothetical protein [Streptomyces sp. NPDC007991]|uniref:hypothetical protein n=1 Tax=Streptomyces sp. NPDC007991 TaxID=3364803 RepID=UPI0036E3D05B